MVRCQKNQAFTIVELLIVIVVIGILAAITIIAYNGITTRATEASMQADLRGAATTLEIDNQRDGSYPASAAAANDGKGLSLSNGNQLNYTLESYGYCIDISNQKSSNVFRLKSSDRQINKGQGCQAVDTLSTIGSNFGRSSVATQSHTYTMPDAYTPQRWLVGVVMRRNQTTTSTVTVDSTSVSSPMFVNTGGFGYTWFVAQPTGSLATVEFTSVSSQYEFAFSVWEVFSPTKPVIGDSSNAAVNSPATINGYPGGAVLAAAIYNSATAPGGDIVAPYLGGGAGWYMYAGATYPTGAGSYTFSVPSGGGSVVVIKEG
jgi:prepilin-type N-terminal cleavage/methylation domain-containing protein